MALNVKDKVITAESLKYIQDGLQENIQDVEDIIASEFDTSQAYSIGEYCIYNHELYQFITAHPAGAWNTSHVTKKIVTGEISELKSDLNNNLYEDTANILVQFTITNNKWSKKQTDVAFLASCNPGDTLYIDRTSGNGYIYYAILASADNMANGNSVVFASGYSGVVSKRTSVSGALNISIPEDGYYVWVLKRDSGIDFTPDVFTLNGLNAFKTLRGNVADNLDKISVLNDRIDELFMPVQYSLGGIDELSPYDGINLKYAERIAEPLHEHRYAITVNHDDLQKSDYINTRKVYNKFGFRANFNFILLPFANTQEMSEKVLNVKKLIAEGHRLGLHAIFSESFWLVNKLFDITPTSGFTFAPTLSELTTVDHDGLNVFGIDVDTSKTLSYYKFVGCPSAYASTAISSLSSADYANVIGYYTWLFNTDTYTGLDLDGNTQTWRYIQWLEHWYNNLIDDSLGYTTLGTPSEVYGANYAVPTGASTSDYYPDATHLKNGKIIYYDDINNPNYNDSSYQKVGRFTQGLFKGAASCCNYEVQERCIQIARAFCQHYFSTDKFDNYGQHGVKFVNLQYRTENQYDQKIYYDNRDKTILSGIYGKVYSSIRQQFETGTDVLKRQGIKMTNHAVSVTLPVYEAQQSLYRGQNGKRSPFFAFADMINYFTLMGTSTEYDGAADSEKVIKILADHPGHEIQFIYENTGQQVTSSDGTATLYIHPYFKTAVDLIRGSFGTGKIPFFSLDTIMNNPSNIYAVELLSRYCWYNDVDVIPLEEARVKSLRDDWTISGNYFPNPNFSQSLLKMFGGSSSSKDAYRPDGWVVAKDNGTVQYSVDNNEHKFSMTASGTSNNKIYTRIWGLPAGNYQLKFTAKSTGEHGVFEMRSIKNGDNLVGQSYTAGTSEFAQGLTTIDTEYTTTFAIPEPCNLIPDSSPESIYSDGYEDNVVEVRFILGFEFGSTVASEETVSIHDIKLVRQ